MIESGLITEHYFNSTIEELKFDIVHGMENPVALTPIRHTNLALNNAGVWGSILMDFLDTPHGGENDINLIGNFENFTICVINYGIECPIRPLSYISKALMQVTEQSLFTHNFVVFDNQASYVGTTQRGYKQIALPFWN